MCKISHGQQGEVPAGHSNAAAEKIQGASEWNSGGREDEESCSPEKEDAKNAGEREQWQECDERDGEKG